MPSTMKSLGIDRLPIDERLSLVEEIWESIAADPAAFPLSDAQRAELDRRIAAHDANPEAVIAWAEVKASVLSRLRQ